MDVVIYCYQLQDPGLFMTYATLTPKTSHTDAEKIIKKAYAEITEKGVTAAEVARAKRALRVALAQRRDGIYSLLANLNEDLAAGDWTRFATLPGQLSKITAADVKRVAKKYLVDDQSTVGWFVTTTK
jgi:zinc protease